jgi:hypothetical protein
MPTHKEKARSGKPNTQATSAMKRKQSQNGKCTTHNQKKKAAGRNKECTDSESSKSDSEQPECRPHKKTRRLHESEVEVGGESEDENSTEAAADKDEQYSEVQLVLKNEGTRVNIPSQNDGLEELHRIPVAVEIRSKKDMARDILLIFTDKVDVKFVKKDGATEEATGRWCTLCQ